MSATVLIVDDMADNLILLESLLSENYNTKTATSGQHCLNSVAEDIPDLILLDLVMPGLNGFEVCEKLKSTDETQHIPIIFITSSTCDDEKLKAYELGADDFINKPFNFDELTAKVSRTISGANRIKDATEMANAAQQAALIAMTNSSELGMIIKFMEAASECESFLKLAQHLEEVTKDFGLLCCFQFEFNDIKTNLSNGCEDDSLEARMISEARKVGGIIGHGKRMFFNQKYVSMLVKNMPVDDEEKCGRYKDNLSVLMSSANGIARTIGIELSMAEQRKTLVKQTFDKSFERTQHVLSLVNHLESSTVQIVQEIRESFEEALFSLGISEDQESYLLSMFDGAMDKMETVKETTTEVESAIKQLISDFKQLLSE